MPIAPRLLRLAAPLLLAAPVAAHAQIGGPINTLTFGSFALGSSDVKGRLGVGGALSATGFGVGDGLPSVGGNTAVVGGSASLQNGQINGGSLVVGGASSLVGVGIPDGTSSANVSPLPVDFAALQTSQTALADALAAQATNGTSVRQPWGAIELTGGASGVNYFSFVGSWFGGATSFSITTPASATAIVTITGSVPTITNFGMFLSGVTASHVLLNFVDAATLASLNFSFEGSVLAPHAAVTGQNGHVEGDFVAASFQQSGSFEFHYTPFGGPLPPTSPVPEPATVALVGGGLALLGAAARRRRR